MSQTQALATVPIPRTDPGASRRPPTLIRVPRVEAASDARKLETSPTHAHRRSLPRRPRRRLRKEFRVAAYTLALLTPLSLAWAHRASLGVGSTQGPRPHASSAATPTARRAAARPVAASPGSADPLPRVLLSIEPVGSAVEGADVPVTLPGYLLPDDHHEEPSHEGS